ncbi:MAG: hypothetical protein J6A25_00400 [Lachnospiraceae bacterium]|nr:hypothetical protein [Lachnospiraceae bacterium]
MPRINIHEVDNTKPGSRAYSNYSVVVPGFHAPYMTEFDDINLRTEINGIILQKEVRNEDGAKVWVPYSDEDIFGDTGVLEIKTQADFEQYIGLVKPQRIEEGFKTNFVAKEVVNVDDDGNPSVINYYNGDLYDSRQNAEFYVTQDKENDTIAFRYLLKMGQTNIWLADKSLTFKYSVDGYDVTLYHASYDEKKGVFNIELDDDGNKKVVTDAEAFVTLNADQEIVKAGIAIPTNGGSTIYEVGYSREDVEEVEGITYEYETAKGQFANPVDVAIPAHYGNQIAYELLGLGYTVLYVNMGEYYPTRNAVDENITVEENGKQVAINIGQETVFEALKNLGRETFWAELRDKTTYDYRFVLTGFIDDNNGFFDLMKNANYEISKLASWEKPGDDPFAHVRARGDVLALVDLDESAIRETIASTANGLGNTTKRTIQAIQKELGRQNFGSYGKYSAVFTPSITYTNNLKIDFYENSHFPASFHYLACFAKSVFTDNNREWFAVAGFTRGLSVYNIDSTAFKLGDIAVQALEPRYLVDGTPVNVACNVIVHNRGSYYIWGNRTAHTLLKTELIASHFLNIRQLCITLKKYIYNLCRNFTFDPNSDILWSNFVTALTPLLEQMKANQGIRDYLIEKVATDLKGVLAARVRIVPIEAVEDFEIEVALEDSIGGTTATVNE